MSINNTKHIFITNPVSSKLQEEEIKEETTETKETKKMIILTNSNENIKNIQKKEKEKKMRVETSTWGLNNDDLAFKTQLELLRQLNISLINDKTNDTTKFNKPNKEIQMLISHIKSKISSYKHQDILKKKLNNQEFVSFVDVVTLLNDSNMKCYYCDCETYLLYEIVREMKQWSLDRINNDIGHNKNNLVICCLECNLKRRRTNKDAFFFTKNLKITKENHIVNSNPELENLF